MFSFSPGLVAKRARLPPERWTYSETGPVPIDRFVAPTRLRYPTFDPPREIPCWRYTPAPHHPRPYPVGVYIHGGPASQIFPTFLPANHPQSNQVLLEQGIGVLAPAALTLTLALTQGIGVLAPDVRGSSGYGKSYIQLDDWEKREDSVRDIGCLLDWIEAAARTRTLA